MFVRRKVNRSGSISVHVVDKSRGGFKVIKTFGTASTAYGKHSIKYDCQFA